jgi:hypothetical protein
MIAPLLAGVTAVTLTLSLSSAAFDRFVARPYLRRRSRLDAVDFDQLWASYRSARRIR